MQRKRVKEEKAVPYFSSALRGIRGDTEQWRWSNELGVSQMHISHIENGTRAPSPEVLTRWLAKAEASDVLRPAVVADILRCFPRAAVRYDNAGLGMDVVELLTRQCVSDIDERLTNRLTQAERATTKQAIDRLLDKVLNRPAREAKDAQG